MVATALADRLSSDLILHQAPKYAEKLELTGNHKSPMTLTSELGSLDLLQGYGGSPPAVGALSMRAPEPQLDFTHEGHAYIMRV